MKRLLLALILAYACAACSPVAGVPAEYCAAVDVHGKEPSERLAARFDTFAASHGLSGTDALPGPRFYESRDRLMQISVSFGMGDYGAIVALFRSPDAHTDTLKSLAAFVEGDLARHYKVTPCGRIKGFRTPELF